MGDLLPNDSTFFLTDKADGILINREKGNTLESYPVIEDTLQWFEIQAQEAEKLTNIDLESKIPPEAQILAFQELASLLRAKKGDLEVLVSTYVKNRKK